MKTIQAIDTIALDVQLQQQIKDRRTPGIYYAFFDADTVLHDFAGGIADLANRAPVSPQSVFHGYSVTKLFTATAILQLAEQGKLNLQEPVKAYLPDFAGSDGVLLRHLLTHSAGLPNPLPISWVHRPEDDAGFDEGGFFGPIFRKNVKPGPTPNSRFAYSNLNYLLLGQVIGRVSGLTYRQYVEQHLLEPLSVGRELGFVRQKQWEVATGYHKAFSFGNLLLGFFLDKKQYMGPATDGWKSFRPFYLNGSAYGGLIGRPAAFIAFAQDFLKPQARLLSAASRKQMLQENRLNDGKASGMCLAWYTGTLSGQTYFCHAGGGGGYYCELRIYPEAGYGSAVFMNRSGYSDARFLDKTDRHIFGE